MSYEYFVIVDAKGHAGLAVTIRSKVEDELRHDSNAKVIAVHAPNAFEARRQAVSAWTQADGKPLH